jgi:hypothetical protein
VSGDDPTCWAASPGSGLSTTEKSAIPPRVATTGEEEPKREVVFDLPDKSHKVDNFAGLPWQTKTTRLGC